MQSSLNLTTVGLDVLIHVMECLRPPDVINLRKTCKVLEISTYNRTVWLNALDQMMEEHHIPRETFQTASMDREALEHLALSPAKFARLIETTEDVAIRPCSHRVLQDYVSDKSKAKLGIAGSGIKGSGDLLLAPGGRFLITSRQVIDSSMLVKNLVQLWDLGICGQDKCKLLAEEILTEEFSRLRSISRIPGSHGFYLISEQKSQPPELNIHKVLASDVSPKFEYVNAMITEVTGPLTVCGTRLAVLLRSTLVIWDFQSDLSVRWRSGVEEDNLEYPSPIHLYPENVLLHRKGKIYLWKIPELYPGPETKLIDNLPLLVLSNLFQDSVWPSEPIDDEMSFTLAQSPCSQGSSSHTLIGVNREDHFRLYRVQHLPTLVQEVGLPSALPISIGASVDTNLRYLKLLDATVGPLQQCDRRLMFFVKIINLSHLFLHRMEMLTDGSKLDSPSKKELFFGKAEVINYVQLDVATGRLCIAVDDSEIRIIDYLQPP